MGRLHTTRDGQLKGKLAYMAPEQVRAGPIDCRTDVYAASVVLWEALTGARLFEGENDAGVLHAILTHRAPPPSSLAPGLPPALDALVLRGLSADPDDRFPTTREMARALEDAVRPVIASRLGDWVGSVAVQALAERTVLVEKMEMDSATGTNASHDGANRVAHGSSRHSDTDLLTQVSSTTQPLPSRRALAPSRKTVLAVSIVTVVIGLLAWPVTGQRFGGGGPPSPSSVSSAAPVAVLEPVVATPQPSSDVPERQDAPPAASTPRAAPKPLSPARRRGASSTPPDPQPFKNGYVYNRL